MTLSPAQHTEYMRKWTAKNRADYMVGKFCVHCGSTNSLEVDHVDPEQKVSHRIWSWSAARRTAELAKCQILCTDCHLTKTLEQRKTPEHGTVSRYSGKQKCRCEPCKAANRERCALNRAKQRERRAHALAA